MVIVKLGLQINKITVFAIGKKRIKNDPRATFRKVKNRFKNMRFISHLNQTVKTRT